MLVQTEPAPVSTPAAFYLFAPLAFLSWKTAKLVMMNEQVKLAPDREAGKLGSDNNYEYRLTGSFSGQLVYEPASDQFYPEFLLKGYELKSQAPARIYSTKRQEDPAIRILAPPL